MIEVLFNYKGIEKIIQCDKNKIIKDIFLECSFSKGLDINNIIFLYNLQQINSDLTFREISNQNDKENNKTYIFVYEKNNINENESNNIICPNCGENYIYNTKLSLFQCKNNHDIESEMNKLRKNLDNFKKNAKEIIKIINEVIYYIEEYYKTNYNNINNKNYKNDNKKNKIKNDIIKYTNKIINENNIHLNTILNIYNRINSNITIKYKIEENIEKIKLFGIDFVKENKNNCDIIYNDKIYELTDSFNKEELKANDIIEIKLTGIDNITNMVSMFQSCSSLLSIPDIYKWNTVNVNNMSKLFFGCSSILELPDISNFNTINVIDMSNMFSGCRTLKSLPDISNWNTSNVINMNGMFCGCSELLNLPEINKWDTGNVINMNDMFYGCRTLLNLPDIGNWNVSNVKDMSYMFRECFSLLYLPDISKWNIINVTNMSDMFNKCISLSNFPDISKWNTINLKYISSMFSGCRSLTYLPDISKWNVEKVNSIGFLFYNCISLSYLPDLSNWHFGGSCYKSCLNENDVNVVKMPFNFSY